MNRETEIFAFMEGLIMGYTLFKKTNETEGDIFKWALLIAEIKYSKLPLYKIDMCKIMALYSTLTK